MDSHDAIPHNTSASEENGLVLFCTECGSPIRSGSQFCINCGSKVVGPVIDEPSEEYADGQLPVAEEPAIVEAVSSENPISEPPAAEEIPVCEATAQDAGGISIPAKTDGAVETAEPEAAVMTKLDDEAAKSGEGESKPARTLKPWMKIAAIVVAVIVVIGIIVAVVMSNMAKDYEQAGEYYKNGQYAEAAEAYQKLGGYSDSAEWCEKANKHVDAKALEDAAGEDPDAWKAAAAAYEEIDDDVSSEDAQRCYNTADYYTAIALMEKKDWQSAKNMLDDLVEAGFRNSQDLRAECAAHITYDNASKAYDEGKYYEAYTTFKTLQGNTNAQFDDLDKRIQACIQDYPSTGIVYRNGDWSNDNVELTIVNSGNPNAYYKLYRGDTLALTVFIPADGEATFRLQDGTYSMNKAYGDTWFGPDDMFGDEGSYYTCSFDGSKTFDLEAYNGYEISSGSGGTGIGTNPTDRNSI